MKFTTILAAALLTGIAASAASADTIDFTSLADGTVVSNQFDGVVFSISGGPGPDGSPLASSNWTGAGVELNNSTTGIYPSSAFLNINFTAPASDVSFTYSNYGFPDGESGGNGASFWTTFDASNTVLDTGLLSFIEGYSLVSVGSGVSSLVITNNTGGNSSWVFGLGELTFNGAVPEPGTWTMMIIGFGAIGVGMRRRQAIAA